MKNSIRIRINYLLFPIILVFTVFSSCKITQQSVDTKDLSYLYNPTKNPINPRYNIINQSDESSTLSVRFSTNDLYFSEANPQGVPTSMILVTVKLFNISQGILLTDTIVYNLNIRKQVGKQEYIYYIPLKVNKGTEYMTEIKILDKIRLSVSQAFVPFNTLNDYNRYNFKVLSHFGKNEVFNPVLRANEYVNLVYSKLPIDSLYITIYKPFQGVPNPPYVLLPEKTLDYEPEKVIAINYSDTLPIMLPKEGIYLCTVGRDIKEGYTFYNMGTSYPAVTSPELMIEPLAYIASQDEISELRSAIKPKVALDDFWIKCGGNVDKARELIRIYYTRVLYSNFYFTSYKEGWQSERGMIYIIYGPPDKVYKTSEGESWGYKEPATKSSWGSRYTVKNDYLFFNFKKRQNIFSDNDYYLSRNETLVTYWDKAILSWRRGIVFRLDNPSDIYEE